MFECCRTSFLRPFSSKVINILSFVVRLRSFICLEVPFPFGMVLSDSFEVGAYEDEVKEVRRNNPTINATRGNTLHTVKIVF